MALFFLISYSLCDILIFTKSQSGPTEYGVNKMNKYESKQFYSDILVLLLPIVFQNLINVGVTMTDVVMLGNVNETSLAACSLAGQIQFIMMLVFSGLTAGASVLTAQYWGKKDTRTIEKVMAITMRFSLCIGLFFCPSGYFYARDAHTHLFSRKYNYQRGQSIPTHCRTLLSIYVCH